MKGKKLLAILLAVLMLVGSLGINAFATEPADAVASVGENYYTSLQAAIDAAEDNATVTLLKDIEISLEGLTTSDRYTLATIDDKNLTVDLNGKKVSAPAYANDTSSNAYLVNYFKITGTSKVVLKNGTLDGASGETDTQVICVTDTAEVELRDVTSYGNLEALMVRDTAKVDIYGGTYGLSSYVNSAYASNPRYPGFLSKIINTVANAEKRVTLYGGVTVVNQDPRYFAKAPLGAEGHANTINLAPGYTVEQSGNNYNVVKITDGVAQVTATATGAETLQFYTLDEAVAFYKDNTTDYSSTITLLKDVNLDKPAVFTNVTLTLDLNGKTISTTDNIWYEDTANDGANSRTALISVAAGGDITVTGNGFVTAKEDDCYAVEVRGGKLTINGGSYNGNISAVYAKTGEVVINGGTFDIQQKSTDVPYALLLNRHDTNANAGTAKIIVSGGSFKGFDPFNNTADGAGTNYNADADAYETKLFGDTYKVVAKSAQTGAVAAIGSTKYDTIQAAVDAANPGATITVLLDADITEPVKVGKKVTIDLAGKTIFNTTDIWHEDAADGANSTTALISVVEGGDLTITGNGCVTAKANDCYAVEVRGGKLTINGGSYNGNISAVYAKTGEVVINGGTFDIQQIYTTTAPYGLLLNCFDASYTAGTAKITVKGGSFKGFDPANTAEANGASFVPTGYNSALTGEYYAVTADTDAYVAQVGANKYFTLQDAIDAAAAGDTVKLIKDITVAPMEMTTFEERGIGDATNHALAFVNKELTIDMDGHTISYKANAAYDSNHGFHAFVLTAGANLTLTGDGTVNSWLGTTMSDTTFLCFRIMKDADAELTIENGSYYGNDTTLYVQTNGGIVNIEGGYFRNYLPGGHLQTLNASGYLAFASTTANSKVVMTGGTLAHDDPRYVNDGNMVPAGYVVSMTKNAEGVKEFTVIPESTAVASVHSDVIVTDSNHNDERWNGAYGVDFPTEAVYHYTSLADAIANAEDGNTVKLLADVNGAGIKVPAGKFGTDGLTIDLGGHTYTIVKPTVGSTGTETNGFQFLKDNAITITNGKITSAEAKFLIQNYSDLTLVGVELDGSKLLGTLPYTLSNNNGIVQIMEGTTIKAASRGYAFDVCDFSSYAGTSVYVYRGCTIEGLVQISNNNGGDMNSALYTIGASESNPDGAATISVDPEGTFTKYTTPGDYEYNAAAHSFDDVSAARKLVVKANGSENVDGVAATVKAGETFTVTVVINGENISGGYYELGYDTSKFQFVSSVEGISPVAGKIKHMFAQPGSVRTYADGDAVATFTFKALATSGTGDFTFTETRASTEIEAISSNYPVTANNEKVTVEVENNISAVTIKVDGTAVADSSKSVEFDGNAHTVTITTDPAQTLKYKVNGTDAETLSFTEPGTYVISYETKETVPGLDTVSGSFTLTITEPAFVVEVIDDYTAGTELILVYTNSDKVCFKYDGSMMVDVSVKGYKYENTTEYDYVYGFVTFAQSGVSHAYYENLVTYQSMVRVDKLSTANDTDVNGDRRMDENDVIVVFGVYNVSDSYYGSDAYQIQILRSDVTGDKHVTGNDTALVVGAAKTALGIQ